MGRKRTHTLFVMSRAWSSHCCGLSNHWTRSRGANSLEVTTLDATLLFVFSPDCCKDTDKPSKRLFTGFKLH